jgi:1-acyl-sn-glycerol-3-phosphate acyltransferase
MRKGNKMSEKAGKVQEKIDFIKYISRLIPNIFLSLIFRIRWHNSENVPENGAALLFSNHVGQFDMFLIAIKIKRWIYWMAKEELYKIRLLAVWLKGVGAFPVKRNTSDIRSARTVFKLLKEGKIVGIFPEGTRQKKWKSDLKSVKSGAALFALKAGVPLVPVAIKGDYKLFRKIDVYYGKPYRLYEEPGKKYTRKELTEISRNIMINIYSLAEEK